MLLPGEGGTVGQNLNIKLEIPDKDLQDFFILRNVGSVDLSLTDGPLGNVGE